MIARLSTTVPPLSTPAERELAGAIVAVCIERGLSYECASDVARALARPADPSVR